MKLNDHYSALLTTYTDWLQTLGFSSAIVYNHPKSVAFFFEWLHTQGVNRIDQLTQKHVYSYFTYLETRPHKRRSNQGLSVAHLNKSFDAIDKLLECLQQHGMQNALSPTKYRLLHEKKTDLQVLTIQEVKALYNAIPKTFDRYTMAAREPRQSIVHLALDLLYGCGLRRSEVINLSLNDVDFNSKVLHVRQAKGYKDRYVPMSKKVYEATQLFVYQHRRYFNRREGMLFPYTAYYIPFCLKIVLKESDLPYQNITPHTLRHSIATHLLQNGMPIERIAEFLGHSSLESTQIYTRVADEKF